MNLTAALGLARSRLLYHGIPFAHRRLIRFYRQFLHEGDIAFDIGSHAGNRIVAFNAIGARTVAVEPQPLFYQYLKRRFESTDVTIVNEGIAAESGTAALHINDKNPTLSTFSDSWIEEISQAPGFTNARWNRTVPIKLSTLDDLIQRFGEPRFCKIDVEGFEEEVLQGLSLPLQSLSFEYLPATKQRACNCIDYLSRLGPYRFNWSEAGTMRLKLAKLIDADAMKKIIEELPLSAKSGDIYGFRNGVGELA